MKIIYILLFVFCTLISKSQRQQIIANVWNSKAHFNYSELILNSDSTYIESNEGCKSIDITKGNWTFKNDSIILSRSTNYDLILKYDFIKGENYSFTFLDYYNLPISGLSIRIIQDTTESFCHPDKNGQIENASKICRELVFNGIQNDNNGYFDYDSSIRFYLKEKGKYIFYLNYPRSFFIDIPEVFISNYENERFYKRIPKNQLVEITHGYGNLYFKKY